MRPEYIAQLAAEEEALEKGTPKTGGKKKGKGRKEPEEDGKATPSTQKSSKKGKGKKDPADMFDPLNFKPPTKAEEPGLEDLKKQLAQFEFKCSACPFGTNLQEEFKTHFKCEWHKINLQRKVKEQPPLTEDQFKEMLILKDFA